MPVGTCKSNADAHPGRIILENQRIRRTRKQMEGDIASSKAAAIAASEDKAGRHRCIAEVEDNIGRNEEELRLHANRPDLCHRASVEPTPSSTASTE